MPPSKNGFNFLFPCTALKTRRLQPGTRRTLHQPPHLPLARAPGDPRSGAWARHRQSTPGTTGAPRSGDGGGTNQLKAPCPRRDSPGAGEAQGARSPPHIPKPRGSEAAGGGL